MADNMSMKQFLEYHLAFVREHLVHAAGTTPQDFYDNGQDWEALDLHDVVVVESLAHSWGCIEGAAAMADLTIAELLEQFGLQLNEPAPKTKVVRGVTLYLVESGPLKGKWVSVPESERTERGDERVARALAKVCPKCGSAKSHRCKTAQCRHCDSCDHAWIPEEVRRG